MSRCKGRWILLFREKLGVKPVEEQRLRAKGSAEEVLEGSAHRAFVFSDEPPKKPVPLHEQTVKDEKGRYQRFHGAFTGGFSAGYFNTVGSQEGQNRPIEPGRVKLCFINPTDQRHSRWTLLWTRTEAPQRSKTTI